MIGLVAFSFALGEIEPNPCNANIARATKRIMDAESDSVVVVAQWEVAAALKRLCGFDAEVVKEHRTEGEYLNSDEVMSQAAEVFREKGVTEVIPVANPFLHLSKCLALVQEAGFEPIKRDVGKIGFYKDSLQWWTRGPLRLLLYAVLQKTRGRKGR